MSRPGDGAWGLVCQTAEVRVSSVASGRQAMRIGKYGEVPEPGRDVQPRRSRVPGSRVGRMTMQALGPGRLEVAVGDESAPQRQSDLTAVGVPGEDRVVAVARRTGRAPVGTARVRPPMRRSASASAGRRPAPGRRTSRCGSSTPAQATVRSPTVSRSRAGWSGRAIRPSRRRRDELLPRELGGVDDAGAVVGKEVPERVAHDRREVVVGAEHERHPARRAAGRARRAAAAARRRGPGCRRC